MPTTTGTHLRDLLDPAELAAAIEQGYVREQTHPRWGYRILNYTEKAQYDGHWTPVTLTCRGLIVDSDDQVIARPFRKFFNHGDPLAGTLDLSAPAVVLDKLDGSLGILYPTPDGYYEIATRGSFTSEQARHATRVIQERFATFLHDLGHVHGITFLFEIVYPGNRIVLDYGDVDDLFLLGAVEIATGRVLDPMELPIWPGRKASTFPVKTLADALAMPPRPDAEGLVVRMIETGDMVKIKQADYVALHAIVTRTSARSVWEFLAVNACRDVIPTPKLIGTRIGLDPERVARVLDIGPDWRERFLSGVPDEFYTWVRSTIDGLQQAADDMTAEMHRITADLRAEHGNDRRAFARAAGAHAHSGALFQLYDGKDITAYVWKTLFPPADKPWGERSEAIA